MEITSMETKRKMARVFGLIAFARGDRAIPCFDQGLMTLLKGVRPGEGVLILKAWIGGYTEGSLLGEGKG